MRTMKANYMAQEHNVKIIRPLNYAREALTREYAEAKGLPVINENCPGCFEAPKERARIKMVLASQEQMFPDLYGKLLKAMLPLMATECVDTDAPILRDLRNSKHAAERSIAQALAGGQAEKSSPLPVDGPSEAGDKAGQHVQRAKGPISQKRKANLATGGVKTETTSDKGTAQNREWPQIMTQAKETASSKGSESDSGVHFQLSTALTLGVGITIGLALPRIVRFWR
mmetsp:Transcript_13168/g.20670  ORF Transcript_13168/g.20670 Transcript_13168/m.20670 type:complete len:228 (+) Transcript_13168:3-686(+)